jgi:hypothetical protein
MFDITAKIKKIIVVAAIPVIMWLVAAVGIGLLQDLDLMKYQTINLSSLYYFLLCILVNVISLIYCIDKLASK